jgi:hypothetical protein
MLIRIRIGIKTMVIHMRIKELPVYNVIIFPSLAKVLDLSIFDKFSGIHCLFDHWIQDPYPGYWMKKKIRIWDPCTSRIIFPRA